MRPLNATRCRYNRYSEDMALDLVFFSAFEDLHLRTSGTMESNGIRKLYEPSPIPTLYVGRVKDLLGPVPLFPCFLDGNATAPFRTSTLHTRSRPSNWGVRMRARDHAVAVIFMRSAPGCGNSADPSLELQGFQSRKQKESAERPGPKHLGALGRLA